MKWPWKRKRVVVLGAELAAAHKAEEERIAAGVPGPSILPPDGYDSESGDSSLVSVRPLPLDLELRSIAKQFQEWDSARRQAATHRLSFDDQHTLIIFAERAAVLALNTDPVEWCRAGAIALSMIDEARVDPRDLWVAEGLLNHAVGRLSEPVEREAFEKAIDPKIRETFTGKSNLSDWGYAEISTAEGVGLIRHGGGRYTPTIDVTTVALQLAEALRARRYVSHVEIAEKVPDVWFASSRREDARSRLSRALAAAVIHGDLRKEYSVDGMQMFLEWVVEMPTEGDCDQLVADVGTGTELDGIYVMGLAVGRLFALLVAGSWQQGVEPYESPSTLAEFAEEARVIMARKAAEGDEH
jgi:hypothetical protein